MNLKTYLHQIIIVSWVSVLVGFAEVCYLTAIFYKLP